MLHRSLSFATVLLLVAPACTESEPMGDDEMIEEDEPVEVPKGDDPTADPEGADGAEAASPCTTGWTYIDCHAQELTLDVDGLDRDVLWQVPAGSPPAGGWPVVLAFHGTNDPPSKMFYWYYYSAVDQAFGGYYQLKTMQGLLESGFAVVAPRGRTMVGGIYWDTNIDPYADDWESGPDAAFMDRIFEEAEAGTFGALDTSRWYATGLSSGAYMSSRMAVAYPDKMRAVALQSGSYATCLSSLPCTVTAADLPDDHPPTLLMAGYWDGIVPLYTIQSYMDALDDDGTEATLEVVSYASHQWTSYSPGWVLDWFQTH